MDQKHAELMLARFGPLDSLMADLMKQQGIQELVALPEPLFNAAMERLRRAHLEGRGFRFLDADHPAGCPTCEG